MIDTLLNAQVVTHDQYFFWSLCWPDCAHHGCCYRVNLSHSFPAKGVSVGLYSIVNTSRDTLFAVNKSGLRWLHGRHDARRWMYLLPMRLPLSLTPQQTAACNLRVGNHPGSVLCFCRRPQSSDVDIGFPTAAGDEDLLSSLRRVLPDEFTQHPPHLVLYGKAARRSRPWGLM